MPLLDRVLQPRPVVLTAIIAITAACVATPASSPLLATCAFACNLPAGARLATCLIGNLRRCGIARRLLSLASPAGIAVLVFGPVASVRLSCMHHQESSGVAALDRDITPRSIHRGSANADHHAHMHSSTGAAGSEAGKAPHDKFRARAAASSSSPPMHADGAPTSPRRRGTRPPPSKGRRCLRRHGL